MPTSSHLEEVPSEDGSSNERLNVEFTNGSLQQLRELAEFFDIKGDLSEVVKVGISFLQNVKDRSAPKSDTDKTEQG